MEAPNLSTKLVEIITQIQGAVATGSDFLLTQMPEIAQQYVLYGRVVTLVYSGFLFFMAVCFLLPGFWAYKNPWNISNDCYEKHLKRSDSNLVVMGISVIIGGLCLLLSVTTFDYLVWLAPKIWLIQELANLVK